MAYKRKNDAMVQTVYASDVEKRFVQEKDFYAIVKVDGVEKLYKYYGKFRSEASAYFNEEARLDGGVVQYVGVLGQ